MTDLRFPDTPAFLTPSLLEEARAALLGAALHTELAQASAHWRLLSEAALTEADMALRALSLVAYRKLSEPKPAEECGTLGEGTNASTIDFASISTLRLSSDERYGA